MSYILILGTMFGMGILGGALGIVLIPVWEVPMPWASVLGAGGVILGLLVGYPLGRAVEAFVARYWLEKFW